MPAFIVLKKATNNKQDIITNSPNKTFLAEWKSLIELEIINKKPIPKLIAATTSAKPSHIGMFLLKQMEQSFPLRKPTCLKEIHPVANEKTK